MTRKHLRAAIYARYSTDKQNERSIEDQIALCRTLAERAGYVVTKIYDDRAVSGASTVNRGGFLALMRDGKRHEFDVVITEDIDRISRDQADYHAARKQLKFYNVEIYTANGLVGEIDGSVRAMLSELYLSNLAHKTRRGLAGVVRDRRHAGGRAFGYRPVEGAPGQLAIDEREAETVRRIFADYLAGRPPREIAAALNREKVPGPRGGVWNASTIAGSRVRANGVLMNALYAGRIVWNRQRFVKDPETGRRVSRPNLESEWLSAEVPELRIVDQKTFEAAQNRKAARAGDKQRYMPTRPRYLLSGLLKCGVCGGGYVVIGRNKRGAIVGCSRLRETGLCTNRRTLSLEAFEARVIDAIDEHLAAPELIADYVRQFHARLRELHNSEGQRRRAIEGELAGVTAAIEKVVDMLVAGTPTRALRDRLVALEGERERLEADLAAVPAPAMVELHPNAAERFRRQVADLKKTLASMDPARREKGLADLRKTVEKIVIYPTGAYKPIYFKIYGDAGRLLRLSEEAAAPECHDEKFMRELVAGVGFEPTTFRL